MAGRLESRTLSDTGLKQFIESYKAELMDEWPRKRWNLETLTLAAFYYHSSLKVARADWDSAKAAVATAGGRPNPTLTAGPGYNFSAAGATPWLPFASLDVPIETAGKRGKRIKEARHLSEEAVLSLVKAGWQVRSRLRAALVDFSSATQRDALLGKQISLQERTLAFLEKRHTAGAISGPELTPVRLALQKLLLDRNDAKRQSAEARSRVAESIGVPAAALDGIELDFDLASLGIDAGNLSGPDARRRALLSRADVLAGLSDYAASEAALELEVAKQYPDLRINPGYQLDDGQHKWTLGASIDLPILNQNQGPIAEAGARRSGSAARFEAIQANVIAEVDQAVAVLQIAEASVGDTEKLLGIQRRQEQSVEQQYRAGSVDRVELIAAQVELAASEAALLDTRAKRQQALGALEDAVQQPLNGSEALDASMLDHRQGSNVPKSRKRQKP